MLGLLNTLYLCICVFVYLYLGNERVVMGEWIVDVISFQKIFGLYGLKCHIVEIWRDVTFEDGRRTTDDGNVNIVLESAKQDSQKTFIYEVMWSPSPRSLTPPWARSAARGKCGEKRGKAEIELNL